MTDNELVKALRWMSKVRICETKMVNCHECEFHGFCTDPDSDESIANQIVFHEQAAARITQLSRENADLKEAQRWVPVGEKLPEDGVNVITVDKYGRVSKCNCLKSYVTKYGNYDNVTHWQPLPQPPKGE